MIPKHGGEHPAPTGALTPHEETDQTRQDGCAADPNDGAHCHTGARHPGEEKHLVGRHAQRPKQGRPKWPALSITQSAAHDCDCQQGQPTYGDAQGSNDDRLRTGGASAWAVPLVPHRQAASKTSQ